MDFENNQSIGDDVLLILSEIRTEEKTHFNPREIAEAFKAKFDSLDTLDTGALTQRIGSCLSTMYRKYPGSVSRVRNDNIGIRSGGTYLYGVATILETEKV